MDKKELNYTVNKMNERDSHLHCHGCSVKASVTEKGNKISRVVAIFVSNFEFKDMSDRNCARRRQPKTMLNFF